MFASTELAARIEAAESRLISGAARSVAEARPDQGIWMREIAGGVAVAMGGASPLNKVAGLGFDGLPTAAELDEIESAFSARGIPVQVELASLGDPALARTLTRRGYELVGFEDVHGRPLTGQVPDSVPKDLDVVEVDPSSFDSWLDVVVEGFAHPDDQGVASHESFPSDVLRSALRDMAGADGVIQILALREEVPVGAASYRIDAGVAQLAGAATLPEHRRRGVQTTLLDHRLARARRAGCDVAVVTTSPGSRSQHNVQRRGFSLLYTRAILVRA